MLLVYDGTVESQAALAHCSRLSLALSAEVDVMSVVDSITSNARSAGMLSDLAYTHLEEAARHTLHTAVGKLAENGVTAHGYLCIGRTVDAVSRHAVASRSDIVVVGHRSRRGLSRWFGQRPLHLDLAERLRGSALVTVTVPLA
jgi:nucleotide-binding universal stress UspA family protein